MNFQRFTGPGSIAPRRAFWDKVFASVMSARKTEGKNASVTEYEGQGTLVAFKRDRGAAPTTECPPCVQVTFSGVSFDCDCIGWDGQSRRVTDSAFNGFPAILCRDSTCEPFPEGICQYDSFDFPDCFSGSCEQLSLHFEGWLTFNEDCSGDPTFERDGNICETPGVTPYVVFTEGQWYVVCFAYGMLVFFGSADNISDTITNMVSCSADPNDWGDPTFCGVITTAAYRGAAHGGIATIESVDCPGFSPAP